MPYDRIIVGIGACAVAVFFLACAVGKHLKNNTMIGICESCGRSTSFVCLYCADRVLVYVCNNEACRSAHEHQ